MSETPPSVVPAAPAHEREIAVGDHRLLLLRDGREAYPAMLAAIGEAQQSICLETYILRDDAIGARFSTALRERARAGVEVSVLYDAFGSSVSTAFLETLRGAGVRTLPFHPLRIRGPLGDALARFWRRDHRKAIVIDGRRCVVGGLNIALAYAAPEEGGGGWRDTALRIEGPAAARIEQLFASTWLHEGGAPFRAVHSTVASADPALRIVESDLRPNRRFVRREYIDAIDGARSRVWLTHGYFLPPRATRQALVQAAKRGVDVRIILGGNTDVPAVLYAARSQYAALLRAGIRVFEWTATVLHAKTAVIDSRWSTVGSSNLDALSLLSNLEVNAFVVDAAFAQSMEAMFAGDQERSEEISEAWVRFTPLRERAAGWLLYLCRAWL